MKVALFIPCSVDLFFPEIGIRTLQILEREGCEVSYNQNQTCCGRWLNRIGRFNLEGMVLEKFIHDHFNHDYIVCPDVSCLEFVQENLANHEWKPIMQSRVRIIKSKLLELTDFMVNILDKSIIPLSCTGNFSICDYPSNVYRNKTFKALKHIIDYQSASIFTEIQDNRILSANSIQTLFYNELSEKIISDFYQEIAFKSDAEYFVDADVVAVSYFKKYIMKEKLSLKVMHTTELF